MPFVTHDGARLYWRQDGDTAKPTLLLLNSIGTDIALWDLVVPHLLSEFRVLRMDTRGHGASDAPDGAYSLDQLASDALAVLDTAGAREAIICGVSLGGMTAMALALMAPDRVTGLVLACTSAQMDAGAWQSRMDTVVAGGTAAIADLAMQRFFSSHFRQTHPESVETLRAGLLGMSAAGYAGCCAAIRDMDLLSRLPTLDIQTLVVHGHSDASTPFAGHGDRIIAAIRGATSTGLETGHLPCLEAPAALAGLICAFGRSSVDGPAHQAAASLLYEAGLRTRRAVLGDGWVDQALAGRTAFNADFQAMITRYAWDEIWNRPGLDHRTRRLLVVAMTATLGRWEEFRLHVKCGLEQGGFTPDELKEVLMQTAIYAGVPVANTAFAEAADLVDAWRRGVASA